jgi:hypothetical protein
LNWLQVVSVRDLHRASTDEGPPVTVSTSEKKSKKKAASSTGHGQRMLQVVVSDGHVKWDAFAGMMAKHSHQRRDERRADAARSPPDVFIAAPEE